MDPRDEAPGLHSRGIGPFSLQESLIRQVDGFFSHMPQVIGDIFSGNPVAGVFMISMILSLALPKKVDLKDIDALTAETLEKK